MDYSARRLHYRRQIVKYRENSIAQDQKKHRIQLIHGGISSDGGVKEDKEQDMPKWKFPTHEEMIKLIERGLVVQISQQ
jgi:hypothetical protein